MKRKKINSHIGRKRQQYPLVKLKNELNESKKERETDYGCYTKLLTNYISSKLLDMVSCIIVMFVIF
jgi:hypothetical protein